MFKKIMIALLCIAMVLSVSACSNGAEDDNKQSENDQQQSQQDNKDPIKDINDGVEGAQSALARPEKPEGWTEKDATESLHYTTYEAANTLEKFATSAGPGMVWTCIADPMFKKNEDGEVMPWLIDEYEMADDYMSITMHVREGVYFTNGNELNAEDFIFTLEDLRDSDRYPDSFAKNWRNYIGTLELLDEYTFKLNFSQVMPEFWIQATESKSFPIDKDVFLEVGPDAYWENPTGTGPYVLKSWDAANTVAVMEIRQDEHGYFGYELENTWTNVKTITYQYSPEAQTRVASLRTGETQVLDLAPTTDIEMLIEEGFIVQQMNPQVERFVQFACGENDAFYDQKLREAFSLCLDRELLAETIMNGYAIPITWPALKGQYGYQENPSVKYEYDIERAKQLVEESDYNGEALQLITTSTYVSESGELAQAIQSMASEIGLDIEVETCEAAIYDSRRAERDFDLCIANIAGGDNSWYKTANNVIGTDRFNSGRTNQALIDAGLEIGVTVDPERLEELYTTVWEELLTTHDCLTLLYYPIDCAVYDSHITGITTRYSFKPCIEAVVIVDDNGEPV